MWGALLGQAEDMAAPDQAYPILKWSSRLKEFRRELDGTYSVTPEETMTTSFNEALQYRRERYELWGSRGARIEPGEWVVQDQDPPTEGEVEGTEGRP
jgi:hypothetical protein